MDDIEQLTSTSSHALRHTFGLIAVDRNMPVNVVQEILGQENSATTAIYVNAGKRLATEATSYTRRKPKNGQPNKMLSRLDKYV
ncbi:MAG: tyrosine-type recombinase/integrase [Pseudomonadota bacterium]